jgi:maleate cis-trans isomerase
VTSRPDSKHPQRRRVPGHRVINNSFRAYNKASFKATGVIPTCSVDAVGTGCDVGGLTNGTEYVVTVVAQTQFAGDAPLVESDPSADALGVPVAVATTTLAVTGQNTWRNVLSGLSLLGAGIGLVWRLRRRRVRFVV